MRFSSQSDVHTRYEQSCYVLWSLAWKRCKNILPIFLNNSTHHYGYHMPQFQINYIFKRTKSHCTSNLTYNSEHTQSRNAYLFRARNHQSSTHHRSEGHSRTQTVTHVNETHPNALRWRNGRHRALAHNGSRCITALTCANGRRIVEHTTQRYYMLHKHSYRRIPTMQS